MQIKIDPEKDSLEKLNIVAKIIEELKQNKETSETLEVPSEELEKEKPKKKRTRLTKTELFLLKKYKFYLVKTLMYLSNRSLQYDADGEPILKNKKDVLDEVYIDKKQLFDEFTILLKRINIHEPNPFIFEKALKKLQNKSNMDCEAYGTQFHIEKTNNLYRVIF